MAKDVQRKVPEVRFKGFTDDWEQRKLKDTYQKISNAFVGTASPYYVDNGYFYLESNNIKNGQINHDHEVFINTSFYHKQSDKLLHTGDLVMVQSGHVGNTAVITQKYDATAAHALIMFRNPQNKIISAYLNCYFQSPTAKNRINVLAIGNTIKHILASDMSRFSVFFPNFNEQKHIYTLFKKLQNILTLQQRKLEQLKLLKRALLQNLFTNNRYPKIRFKGSEGPWEQRKVSNVAERLDNLRIPIAASRRKKGTTPYYGANGVQDYVAGFTHDGENVLIAEDGANDIDNYPVRFVKGKIWVNNHAHVLKTYENIMDNRFLVFALKKAKISKYLVGGSRAKLNADILMNISLMMPDFEEQKRIGSLFAYIDNLTILQQAKLNKLQTLKKFLLQKLFI